jgi:GMP synthase-like glutamine amidotransferase
MMRIAALYHVPFEKLGYIEDWIIRKGHILSEICLYNNQKLPQTDDFDMLIIMGGNMSIHDEQLYSWLKEEKEFIRRSVLSGKSVLGICLGAQLIAAALCSRVYQGRAKEIGWFPVQFTREKKAREMIPGMPQEMTVFHWHGETFDLPSEAVWLAKSEVTDNQAFIYNNRVLAVQFHLEMKPESVSLLINNAGDELIPGPYVQPAGDLPAGLVHIQENQMLLESWLEYLERSLIS